MKKYIKYLIGIAFFVGLCINGISANSTKTYATNTNTNTNSILRDQDIFPPTGSITIENAANTEGAIYVSRIDIILNITAEDNVTASKDILMLISGEQVTEADIKNPNNWEPYTNKKQWKLKDTEDGLNHIYLYLKDEAGNISNSLMISPRPTYTISYSGEGTPLPVNKQTKLGVVFNVSTEAPLLENKYFLGWSEVKGSKTVQWGRDGVIEPKYIQTDKVLFAVYSDTPPRLADVVNIGDYVDYPVEYTNVYDAIGTGWRVLAIDGDTVKLVSEGTPLKYAPNYVGKEENASMVIKSLTTNFLNATYYSSGFTGSLTQNFVNKYTQSVRSLDLPDLKTLTNNVINHGDYVEKYGNLIDNGTPYWLATMRIGDPYNMTCIHNALSSTAQTTNGGKSTIVGYGYVSFWTDDKWYYGWGNREWNGAHVGAANTEAAYEKATCGVRPVVTLCSDLTTTGRTDDGKWILVKDIEGSSVTELQANGLAVGDYVKYDADGNLGLTWRVFSIEGDTVNLTLQGNGASYPLGQYDYKDAVLQLNNECARLYSNTGKQITARSMNIEDLNKAVGYIPAAVTTGYKYYPIGTPAAQMETTKIGDVTYTAVAHGGMYVDKSEDFGEQPKFYILDSTEIKGNKDSDNTVVFGSGEILEDDRGKYLIPTVENPVYVRATVYIYEPSNLNSTISGMFSAENKCYLASPCVYMNSSASAFGIRIVSPSIVEEYTLIDSNGRFLDLSFALKPIVSINSRLLEKATDGNTHEWRLKDAN